MTEFEILLYIIILIIINVIINIIRIKLLQKQLNNEHKHEWKWIVDASDNLRRPFGIYQCKICRNITIGEIDGGETMILDDL